MTAGATRAETAGHLNYTGVIIIKRLNVLYGLFNAAALLGTALLFIYACVRLDFSSGLFEAAGKPLSYAMLLAAVVFELLLIGRIFSMIERLRDRSLIILTVFLFLLMAAGYALILKFYPVLQITDALAMYDEATAFAREPGRVHHAGDLYVYYEYFSNNYFLTLVFAGLIRLMDSAGIKDVYLGLNIFNCLCLMIGCFFGFLAVKEACGTKAAVRALVLLVLNPTFYVLSTWVYSCTVSIPFLTFSVYLAVRGYKTERSWVTALCGGLLGAAAMVSYYLRPTSMFPMIALIVVAFVLLIGKPLNRKRLTAGLIAGAVMLAAMFSTKMVIQPVIDRKFSEVSGRSFPIEHWLMLGSEGDGGNTVPSMNYTMSFEIKEEKAAACRSAVINNYRQAGFKGTVSLWLKKVGITFSDGFSDMDVRSNETERYSPFYRFIAGDHKELLILYSRAFRMATFFLMMYVALASFVKRKFNLFTVYLEIIFLGGLAFYALWEAKSVYSVPFVPVMLMIAAGDEEIKPLVFTRPLSDRFRTAGGLVLAGAFAVLLAVSFNTVCRTDMVLESVTLQTGRNSFIGLEKVTESGITQSFRSGAAINNITLYAVNNSEADPAAGYYFRLLDESGNLLAEEEFTSEKIRSDRAVFSFADIAGGGNRLYTIELKKKEDGLAGGLSLLYQRHLLVDRYEGEYFVNGEKRSEDLLLRVKKSWRGPYMTVLQFAASSVLLLILLLFLTLKKR